jgi:hypothetical protein
MRGADNAAVRSVLDGRGLPNDLIEKIGTMSVVPTDFDEAFPAIARHVSRCNGEAFGFFARK